MAEANVGFIPTIGNYYSKEQGHRPEGDEVAGVHVGGSGSPDFGRLAKVCQYM
jgi:hypothetical protein